MKKLILMLMLCAPMTMMAQKFGKVSEERKVKSEEFNGFTHHKVQNSMFKVQSKIK